MENKINISKDFTDSPGARYKSDGPFSGEEFYEKLLEPKFLEARKQNKILVIDLDNSWGYASSFISGSFGKLSIAYTANEVLKYVNFISLDIPLIPEKIIKEIKNPTRQK